MFIEISRMVQDIGVWSVKIQAPDESEEFHHHADYFCGISVGFFGCQIGCLGLNFLNG